MISMVNILVVEDDKNLQKLMAAVLEQNDYHVLRANDGLQALEILDTAHVDLIICDIMMPHLDGSNRQQHFARSPGGLHELCKQYGQRQQLNSVFRSRHHCARRCAPELIKT